MVDEQQAAPNDKHFAPGILCGVDYWKDPPVQLNEAEHNALKALDRKIAERDVAARREEILSAWMGRWFVRGLQHILPNRFGLGLPQQGSGYHPNDPESRSRFTVNICASYQQIITSALTREFPTTRFKPFDPQEDRDITAAKGAEKLAEEIVRRGNGLRDLMTDESYFLWTDGRSMNYTRYVLDAQRFGYKEDAPEVVPEDENQPNPQDAQPGFPEQGSEQSENQSLPAEDARDPRGWQVTDACGALEVQIPLKANSLNECDYVRLMGEISISRAKATFPEIADRIKPSSGGTGGDDISRLARINTKLGVMNNYLTSDSAAYDVTITRLFLRPSQLLEIEDDQVRNDLLSKFAETGCMVVFAGDEFAEARKVCMDRHWTLTFALKGDGAHRPGLGTSLIPVQKIVNERCELEQDYFVRGVPMTWLENEVFSREEIAKQHRIPGGFNFFNLPPQAAASGMLGTYIVPEPAIEIPPELAESINYIVMDLSQLLCGAVPALFGGDSGNEGVGDALMQRDQAIGRISGTWFRMKTGYADTLSNMIECIAKNHTDDSVKSSGEESVTVELRDLQGKFLCYPDTDENFPESFTQKQARVLALLNGALTNPMVMQLLDDPENAEVIKNAIGLEELTLPVLEARDKQLGEIDILLKSGPAPNPQLLEAQQNLVALGQAAQSGDPQAMMAFEQAQQAVSQIPPDVSTVQVDDLCDDHATEGMTCKSFINSPQGRALKNGTPQEQAGVQNIRLHLQEHMAAQAKQQAAGAQVPAKPLTVSANVKDLPPTEAADVLNKAGIPSQPQDFEAEQVAQTMEKHPAVAIQ